MLFIKPNRSYYHFHRCLIYLASLEITNKQINIANKDSWEVEKQIQLNNVSQLQICGIYAHICKYANMQICAYRGIYANMQHEMK